MFNFSGFLYASFYDIFNPPFFIFCFSDKLGAGVDLLQA